ncbi:MAG: hypothetical protein AB7G48_13465 [Nitrospiraceae bacterium]
MIASIAALVLRASGLLCIFVAGYLVVVHGWDIKYALPVAMAVALMVMARLNAEWRINAAFAWVATVLTCYIFNLVLAFADASTNLDPPTRWVSFQSGEERQDRAKVARSLGVPFDTRSRLEILTDLRSQGLDAWPSIAPRVVLREWWTHYSGPFPTKYRESLIHMDGREMLPIGGVANKLTVYCNENGEYVLYDSDEHGFANPRQMWSQPRIQIAVVGDSFVHGACVRMDESYTALIRRRYPATLNLGNDGVGPLVQIAAIKEYLSTLRPQIVIWSYFEGNDLYDMMRERQTVMQHYLENDFVQGLVKKQSEIDQALMTHIDGAMQARSFRAKLASFSDRFVHPRQHGLEWARTLKLSYVWDLVQSSLVAATTQTEKVRSAPYQPSVGKAELELFRAILAKARQSVTDWGGRLVFVYLPRYERYVPEIGGQPNREDVLAIVRSLEIPVVDMHPVFAAEDDPLALFPFRLPTHYNVIGNRIVAEAVLQVLDKMKLEPDQARI